MATTPDVLAICSSVFLFEFATSLQEFVSVVRVDIERLAGFDVGLVGLHLVVEGSEEPGEPQRSLIEHAERCARGFNRYHDLFSFIGPLQRLALSSSFAVRPSLQRSRAGEALPVEEAVLLPKW